MTKAHDLAGKTFGWLTAIKRSAERPSADGVVLWDCVCKCGNSKTVRSYHLTKGRIYSCGCMRDPAKPPDRKVTHGLSRTPEYRIWAGIVFRCTNPNATRYENYGGRGIYLADRWRQFPNFLEDMGPRPGKDASVERLDNSKGYEPGNCVWADRTQQMRNTRHNVMLTLNGETHCVAEWAEKLNIPAKRIYCRVARGWSDERTLTT